VFRTRKIIKDESGATAVEFAFIMPMLITLCFGLIDFIALFFEYHRANEATRLIARELASQSPLVSQSNLLASNPYSCVTGTCSDITPALSSAKKLIPYLSAANVEVTYEAVDIGNVGYALAYKPLITVKLVDVTYNFMFLSFVPGLPSELPVNPAETTLIGNWY